MPLIPNFPNNLLAEHRNWHHAHHNVDVENPPAGYGEDFLRFHRQYIRKALAWYNGQGYDPALVEPGELYRKRFAVHPATILKLNSGLSTRLSHLPPRMNSGGIWNPCICITASISRRPYYTAKRT